MRYELERVAIRRPGICEGISSFRVVLHGYGGDGTDLNAGHTLHTGNLGCILLAKKTDRRVKAPFGESQKRPIMHCSTNMNAFATHDTTIGMVVQERVLISAFSLF